MRALAGWIVRGGWGLQQRLREQAGQIRRMPGGAVRASWMAWLKGPFGLSMAAATVLGLVGAFGSDSAPFWPRMISFWAFGFFAGLGVTFVVWASQKISWLQERPVVRRIGIGVVMIPVIGGWIWVVMGVLFMHGPKLSMLPMTLGYSAIMSGVMTALSWAIYGRRAPAAAAGETHSTKFLERLPFRLRDADLYAVEAEDHYLRVRTSKGSDLILMRLSDALSELGGVEGAQTHRSWWVAKAGIADVKRTDGRATLTLKDGAEAPVSRTFAPSLREIGWL
jgi:hypothetical protein